MFAVPLAILVRARSCLRPKEACRIAGGRCRPYFTVTPLTALVEDVYVVVPASPPEYVATNLRLSVFRTQDTRLAHVRRIGGGEHGRVLEAASQRLASLRPILRTLRPPVGRWR